jgi:hypothetical protein
MMILANVCPICSTENGRLLRQALWDGPIALSMAAVLLPFVALALVVVGVRALGLIAPASSTNERRNPNGSASRIP